MADETLKHLADITTKPGPAETGPEAEEARKVEKAVADGKVTDPLVTARHSAIERQREEGGKSG
jgi:hypothetical protein